VKKKVASNITAEAEHDRQVLQHLDAAVASITPEAFSRYQMLRSLVRTGGNLDWQPGRTDDRLVIFTERVEMLRFLRQHLAQVLKFRPTQMAILYGQESDDQPLQDTVETFGREQEPVRLLIATDIASEGINLHFLAHKLIHFGIPWSLMTFQQRHGRIDRDGQTKRPHIASLWSASQHDTIRGDLRSLSC